MGVDFRAPMPGQLRAIAWVGIMSLGAGSVGAGSVGAGSVGAGSVGASLIDVAPASRALLDTRLSPRAEFAAPVTPVQTANLFDPPPHPWNAGHRGIDLIANPGQEVRAPDAGVVTFSGTVVDRGIVVVRHPNGLRSSLEPVDPAVDVGDQVEALQLVGHVQDFAGHCAPSHCVHWGLREGVGEGARYLNPLDWLDGFGPVRLLPLEPR